MTTCLSGSNLSGSGKYFGLWRTAPMLQNTCQAAHHYPPLFCTCFPIKKLALFIIVIIICSTWKYACKIYLRILRHVVPSQPAVPAGGVHHGQAEDVGRPLDLVEDGLNVRGAVAVGGRRALAHAEHRVKLVLHLLGHVGMPGREVENA